MDISGLVGLQSMQAVEVSNSQRFCKLKIFDHPYPEEFSP